MRLPVLVFLAMLLLVPAGSGLSVSVDPTKIIVKCTPNTTSLLEEFNASGQYTLRFRSVVISGNESEVTVRGYYFSAAGTVINVSRQVCLAGSEDFSQLRNFVSDCPFNASGQRKFGNLSVWCAGFPYERPFNIIMPHKKVAPSSYFNTILTSLWASVILSAVLLPIVVFRFRRPGSARILASVLFFSVVSLATQIDSTVGFPLTFYYEGYCGPLYSYAQAGGWPGGSEEWCGTPPEVAIVFAVIDLLFFYLLVLLMERFYSRFKKLPGRVKPLLISLFLVPLLFSYRLCGDVLRYPCDIEPNYGSLTQFFLILFLILWIWGVVACRKLPENSRIRKYAWIVYPSLLYIWIILFYEYSRFFPVLLLFFPLFGVFSVLRTVLHTYTLILAIIFLFLYWAYLVLLGFLVSKFPKLLRILKERTDRFLNKKA